MHPFPHRYAVTARTDAAAGTHLESAGLPDLPTAPPPEFDGPGDRWSPETLLVGAVADCFVHTFRAVARASSLPWTALACEAEGVLDRVDRVSRFTSIRVRATLRIPGDGDPDQAMRLLERSERLCLITNSLNAETHLEARVELDETAPAAALATG